MSKQLFFNRFRKFIEKENLFSIHDHILLAVSGGVDSMVMAELFLQSGYLISLAHVNHKTRGKASDQDEMFVKHWADTHQLKFHLLSFEDLKDENLQQNFQAVARERRYHWLGKLAETEAYDYIATAHHIQDRIETALINFSKAAGLSGMRSIPVKNGKIVRPLLFADRKEIEEFAHKSEIQYREDLSNKSQKYLRNKVRHRLLPVFEELFPGFVQNANSSIENLKDSEQLLQSLIQKLKVQWLDFDNDKSIVHINEIKKFKGYKSLIYYLLKPFDFHPSQMEKMLDAGQPGAVFHSPSHELLIDRNKWIIRRNRNISPPQEIKIEKPGLYPLPDGSTLDLSFADEAKINSDHHLEFLDAEKIRFPLRLRPWRPGDVIQPIGLNGKSQKVKDLLVNQKIHRFDKEKIWMLEDQDHPVWLIPLRLDHRVKFTDKTTRYLKLKFSAAT